MSGMVAELVRQALGIPFVITFHALGRVRRLSQKEADGFPDERFEIEERLMREADRVIAECPQDRQDMELLYKAPADRIDIVPCGFDPDEFWPVTLDARQQLGLSRDEFIILQLGRMVPRKGVDNVVRALGMLRRVHGITARLLIVGGETREPQADKTPEIGRLRKIVEQEGLTESVVFVGSRYRSELRDYYTAADVFVTTPWYEPFGLTPLEAMACGRPVIGSAVGGITFTVEDGGTGFLVPPRDPAALAARLRDLLTDASLRQRMGQAARERVEREFTWPMVAERTASLYRALLGRGRKHFTQTPGRHRAQYEAL